MQLSDFFYDMDRLSGDSLTFSHVPGASAGQVSVARVRLFSSVMPAPRVHNTYRDLLFRNPRDTQTRQGVLEAHWSTAV